MNSLGYAPKALVMLARAAMAAVGLRWGCSGAAVGLRWGCGGAALGLPPRSRAWPGDGAALRRSGDRAGRQEAKIDEGIA